FPTDPGGANGVPGKPDFGLLGVVWRDLNFNRLAIQPKLHFRNQSSCKISANRKTASMLFKTQSAAVYGIDASIIEVEVDVSSVRVPEENFQTVGLPDAAVRESRQRIRAALRNCGFEVPQTQITINLAPADIKKEGSGFDLPMAMGILGAYGGLLKKELPDFVMVGEL